MVLILTLLDFPVLTLFDFLPWQSTGEVVLLNLDDMVTLLLDCNIPGLRRAAGRNTINLATGAAAPQAMANAMAKDAPAEALRAGAAAGGAGGAAGGVPVPQLTMEQQAMVIAMGVTMRDQFVLLSSGVATSIANANNSLKSEFVQTQNSFQNQITQANAAFKDDYQKDVKKMHMQVEKMQKELKDMKKQNGNGTTSRPVAKATSASAASGSNGAQATSASAASGSNGNKVQQALPYKKRPHSVAFMPPEQRHWKAMIKHAPMDTFVWTSDIVDLVEKEYGINLTKNSKKVATHYDTVNKLMLHHYNVRPAKIKVKDGTGKEHEKMGFRGFAVSVPDAE